MTGQYLLPSCSVALLQWTVDTGQWTLGEDFGKWRRPGSPPHTMHDFPSPIPRLQSRCYHGPPPTKVDPWPVRGINSQLRCTGESTTSSAVGGPVRMLGCRDVQFFDGSLELGRLCFDWMGAPLQKLGGLDLLRTSGNTNSIKSGPVLASSVLALEPICAKEGEGRPRVRDSFGDILTESPADSSSHGGDGHRGPSPTGDL